MATPDPDYGKDSRDDYEKKHPAETKDHPEYDKAYLDGEEQPTPGKGLTPKQVEALRKKLAERASRYLRPLSGYENGDPRKGPKQAHPTTTTDKPAYDPTKEQVEGGGIYRKPSKNKLTDKEICDSVYHWVEDMFWPKGANPQGSDRDTLEKNWGKANEIDKEGIDIGKRVSADRKSKWYCGEQAQFLAWLLRQLGYKVQYKNIVPSKADSKPPGDIKVHQQTAATNVWYAGSWHLYDPFESFADEDGGLDAYVKKDGDCAAPYSDAYVFIWERGDYNRFSWDAPIDPTTENYLYDHMKHEGWKKYKYISKQAGVLFRNEQPQFHIGLGIEGAACGYLAPEVYSNTLLGARHRPYGRPIASSMGSYEWTPATDECIELNLTVEVDLLMKVFVTNLGQEQSLCHIEIRSTSTDYLQVKLDFALIAEMIPPGKTTVVELPLRVKKLGVPPPPPVTGVCGCLDKRRLYLRWNDTERAASYQLYRSAHEILSANDLKGARLVREVPCAGCEIAWRGKKPAFFAVIAVDDKGQLSELDPEEKSTTVIVPS